MKLKSLHHVIRIIYIFVIVQRELSPGNIVNELVLNNRVIGGIKSNDAKIAKMFYESFCKGKIQLTDVRTAELVKLTENAYRDVNIALANELSMVCDDLNIDVYELIHLSNQHPRVNILNPGCGVGGIV